jgi:UDP-galactopyranose mutase
LSCAGLPRFHQRRVFPTMRGVAMMTVDYLIVGAGFAGSVCAERLTAAGKSVLLIDKRRHIGGTAYDEYNEHGILVHRYGPHIFHTDSHEVFDYLSRFTEWRGYTHRVLAAVDGKLVPFPVNLNTIDALYGGHRDTVPFGWLDKLREMFLTHYTAKQWGEYAADLDPEILNRVRVRDSHNDNYFTDSHQAMPRYGYSAMFRSMLKAVPTWLCAPWRDVRECVEYRELIWTGPLDEYHDYNLGALPYRSATFDYLTFDQKQHQPVAVVNYPGAQPEYTRVTEFKHLTGQRHAKTTIAYEYPCDALGNEPFTPVSTATSMALADEYRALTAAQSGVHLVGRLGTFRYLNMDEVVSDALALTDRLIKGDL